MRWAPTLLFLAACGSPARPGASRIAIAETQALRAATPASPALRLVADYLVDGFQAGRDHAAVVLEAGDGTRWEPARRLLTAATGRLTFEVAEADLRHLGISHPVRMHVVLDRWEPSGAPTLLGTTEPSILGTPAPTLDPTVSEPAPTEKFLPPSVGRGQLMVDVQKAPYRPRLPPEYERAGLRVWGLFKVCVDTQGRVSRVQVLKSADAVVDGPWMETIRGWQHRPYAIDGQAVPFCYPLRLEGVPGK